MHLYELNAMNNDDSVSVGELNKAFDSTREPSYRGKTTESKRLVVDIKKTYDSNGKATKTGCAGDADIDGNNDNVSQNKAPDDVGLSCCDCCPQYISRLCISGVIFCGIFHFSFVGAYGCVLPYISIYMKQLGLSPQQIGLISGLRPIVGFCSAPFWGALGDQFKIRRWLLVLSLMSWLAFFVGLFHIRPPNETDSCPTDIALIRRSYNMPLLHKRQLSADDNQTDNIFSVIDEVIDLVDRRVNNNDTDVVEWSEDELESMTMYRGWMYEAGSLWRVFITCLSLIVAGEVFQSPASALSDTGTLHTLEDAGLSLDNYGYIRAWGALGYGIRYELRYV